MKTKTKFYILISIILFLALIIPSKSMADTTVERTSISSNGDMKFTISGLTLDTSHEYQFGLTTTQAGTVETWHNITDVTDTTVICNVSMSVSDLSKVIDATDTGYITLKDKTDDKIILNPTVVDLKMPLLMVSSNYTHLSNGFKFTDDSTNIVIGTRNAYHEAYYLYEKVTDDKVINKYKSIKKNNGDYFELSSLIKQTPPTTGWLNWRLF